MNNQQAAAAVLRFWFEDCRPRQWFQQSDAFDGEVRSRFGPLTMEALAGQLTAWGEEPDSGLALVLLLDQFSRQLYRDQPEAFSGDAAALALSRQALTCGWLSDETSRPRRQFWLMPFLHSETLADLEEGIPLLERFSDPATAAVARRNRELLLRFGRYPHRNAALGRLSTAEEESYLLTRHLPQCDCCGRAGPLHYRVRSDARPEWRLACPECWEPISRQPGYRYGGTRKANRRQRKR